MDIGNERVAHMLMAEVAPLQDDRTEALPQPSSLFLLAAQQRDALAVFPHAGQGIAEFGLRLIQTFGDREDEHPELSSGIRKPKAASTDPETPYERSAGRYGGQRLMHYWAVRFLGHPIRHAAFAVFIDLNHNTLWA